MSTLLVTLALFLAWLLRERLLLDRARDRVPNRITVTGTRGKSGCARLLGAMLRAEGRRVVVKTTGSEATLVLPDGTTETIPRRGVPSIMEQRDLIRRCARLGADTLVAEIMSIHPENHRMEGLRILRPQTVLFTNARPDHVDAMGWDERAVCEVLLSSVPPGTHLLLPPSPPPLLEEHIRGGRWEAMKVAEGEATMPPAAGVFHDDLCLAAAAARRAGVGDRAVREGLEDFREDAGGLRVWRLEPPGIRGPVYAVSAFAANDPLSTVDVLDHVRGRLPSPLPCTGLLSLRADRADRTLHWIRYLKEQGLSGVHPLFALGVQAGIASRRTPGIRALKWTGPGSVTREVCAAAGTDGPQILFGFGNFKGHGEELAAWWAGEGSRVEL
ncbi:MAG: Mur ligase family protein [bacterium]